MPGMDEFDYIIVGGGSAGCVLANRLVGKSFRVLLLEAGGEDRNPWLHIPVGYGRLYLDPRFNWRYRTASEPELDGREAVIPRGKVLGGSSAINGLLYVRGQPQDFDAWAAAGNTGWGFDDLLPYFKRSEHFHGEPGPWHGNDGPLHVSSPRQRHGLCDAFIRAAAEHAIPENADFNGATQAGAGYFHTTSFNGVRCSSASAFLRPIKRDRNLCVRVNATVLRVLFEGRRAIGVEYRRNGTSEVARARLEVVLAAGAIASPHLLLASGVGPGEQIGNQGIPVIADLPGVGRNLKDHYNVRVAYRCRKPVTMNDYYSTWWGKARLGLEYLIKRQGLLSQGAGYAGAFFSSDPAVERPDVQAHLMLFSTDAGVTQLHPYSGYTVSLYQMRPGSSGHIELGGPSFMDPPTIRFNYLSDDGDRQTLFKGMRRLVAMLEAKALSGYRDAPIGFSPRFTDQELLDYIRRKGSSAHHASCTCRMGDDDAAVVDPELRVRNIGQLRVIDASVMPGITSGNTNAATYAIAEKGADLLIESARRA